MSWWKNNSPASVTELDAIKYGNGYKPSAEYLKDIAAGHQRWRGVLLAAAHRIETLESENKY